MLYILYIAYILYIVYYYDSLVLTLNNQIILLLLIIINFSKCTGLNYLIKLFLQIHFCDNNNFHIVKSILKKRSF